MGLNQHTFMKSYTITIPAFTLEIEAKTQTEALEQFWFDYDATQQDPEWGEPIIRKTSK